MRRVYRTVTVAAVEGGFEVRLDGRPIRTPAKLPLRLPACALAEAVAAEWEAQDETIKPAEMHLTQLASTAIDRVMPHRDGVIEAIAAYAQTDLLCYRAVRPASLVARQRAVWDPLLDWARITYDAPLQVTQGVVPHPQPEAALTAIRSVVAAHDDLRLTALSAATAILGSVVLGLALLARRIGAETAFAAAQLDETYQMERWGEDAEAARRREAMREELVAAARFAALAGAGAE